MKLQITHLYPDLLNLYGDRGNIQCMVMRCRWRGIEAEVTECRMGDSVDFLHSDIILLGGGSDREQQIVCTRLQRIRKDFREYVEDGGTVLAVCGGYQLLGHYYDTPDGRMKGLELVDLYTVQESPRLIGNIVLKNETLPYEIVGFENHGGRTYIGNNAAFGEVVSGYGNNGKDGCEGVQYKNVFGTYLHGPLLPKNPHVCDLLLTSALERKYGKAELSPLDDALGREANRYILKRVLEKNKTRGA
jgi:CobQ-like glutamine amidotransferase family enzyme